MPKLDGNTATIETPNGITLQTAGKYIPHDIVVKPRTDNISATDGSGTLTLNDINAISNDKSATFSTDDSYDGKYPKISLSTSANTTDVNVKTSNSNGGWIDFSGENNSYRVCNASSANKSKNLYIRSVTILDNYISFKKNGLYSGIASLIGMSARYTSTAALGLDVDSAVFDSPDKDSGDIWQSKTYMPKAITNNNADFAQIRIHSSDFSSATVSFMSDEWNTFANVAYDSSGAFVFTY